MTRPRRGPRWAMFYGQGIYDYPQSGFHDTRDDALQHAVQATAGRPALLLHVVKVSDKPNRGPLFYVHQAYEVVPGEAPGSWTAGEARRDIVGRVIETTTYVHC